jgi:hypothetical protein
LVSARWQARQHATETDTLTGTQWDACLERAWRRLWNAHPEAFHVEGELVGELPELPAVAAPTGPVLIEPAWLDVLGAAVAADALGNIVVEDPQRVELVSGVIEGLEARFSRGIGG